MKTKRTKTCSLHISVFKEHHYQIIGHTDMVLCSSKVGNIWSAKQCGLDMLRQRNYGSAKYSRLIFSVDKFYISCK